MHPTVQMCYKQSFCPACAGLNIPNPSLGLTQVAPTVPNAIQPELFYTCTLMDGESRVNEQRIPFYTLRGMLTSPLHAGYYCY